jgi:hypothetical protein
VQRPSAWNSRLFFNVRNKLRARLHDDRNEHRDDMEIDCVETMKLIAGVDIDVCRFDLLEYICLQMMSVLIVFQLANLNRHKREEREKHISALNERNH